MLSRSRLVLILHLKHDGDIFQPVFIVITEDVIALASALGDFIVLLKISVLKADRTHLVKGNLTVLLQSLAHHFRRLLCLQVAVVFDHLFLVFQLDLIPLLYRLLLKLPLRLVAFLHGLLLLL